jgi:hypothetical protein
MVLTSCEKVIDVDLNSANPQYVIEGELFAGDHPFTVHVAKTTDYYGKAPQEQVNDAVVLLKSSTGDSLVVPATGNGLYQLPSFIATAGTTYQLQVTAGGNTYTASSTLPQAVLIDSTKYEYEDGGFGDPGYEVTAYFNDPGDRSNYYRMLVTVNDTFLNEAEDLAVFNDKFNNGNLVKADYRKRFRLGDQIKIELRSIDKGVHDYFTSLEQILRNQNGPAPANPLSNFDGGVLGYFGAYSNSKVEVTIVE